MHKQLWPLERSTNTVAHAHTYTPCQSDEERTLYEMGERDRDATYLRNNSWNQTEWIDCPCFFLIFFLPWHSINKYFIFMWTWLHFDFRFFSLHIFFAYLYMDFWWMNRAEKKWMESREREEEALQQIAKSPQSS